MGARKLLGWIAGLALTGTAAAQQMQIQFAEPVNLVAAPGVTQFDVYGRRFTLSLQSNDRLLKALPARQKAAATRAKLLRGQLQDMPGSWVRLARVDGALEGAIWDGRELYVVTSHRRIAQSLTLPLDVAPAQTVVYRLSDALEGLPAQYCGTEPMLPQSRGDGTPVLKQYQDLVRELRVGALAAPTDQLEIALISDSAFQSRLGSSASDAMLARLNTVDGIFAEQLGVLIMPSEIRLVASGNDPFTATQADSLLNQLADYRNGDADIRAPGLAHLMTGKELNGDTVGIAFIDSLCDRRQGVSLSEGTWGDFLSALIMAHELGHNFGARHDGVAGGACEATPQYYLMAPNLNQSSQFSQCSLDAMSPAVVRARGVCVGPAVYADVSVELPASPFNVDTSATFSLPVTVRSSGNLTATNAHLEVELPPQLTFQSATVENGNCSVSGTAVNCALGDIPAGEPRVVDLQLSSTALGSYILRAYVAAANDQLTNNNTANVQIGLQSAVDLGVSIGVPPGPLYVGDLTEFTFDVSSLRSQTAVGGQLVIHLSGMAIENLSAGAHACSIDTNNTSTVVCQLADVPSGTTTRISAQVRAPYATTFTVGASVQVMNDGEYGNNHRNEQVTFLAERQVVTTVSTEDLRAVVGVEYEVTYTLTAVGRLPSTDVLFQVDLPGSGEILSVTPSEGTCSVPTPQVMTECAFGTLNPGDIRAVVVRLRMAEIGYRPLVGRTTYMNGSLQQWTYAYTWIQSALRVDATAYFYSPQYVGNQGQPISSSIFIGSAGIDPAQNVVVTLNLPAPARLTRFELASGSAPGWTCTTVTPQQGRCSGSFPGQNTYAMVWVEFVSDTAMEGQATLNLTADLDGDPTNNTSETTIRVLQFLDVAVSSATANQTLKVGELTDLEFTVTTGVNPVPAVQLWPTASNQNVEFDSLLVNGTACPMTAVPPAPWMTGGCDLGDLPAGANIPVTLRYRGLTPDRQGVIELLSTTARDSNSSNNSSWVNYVTRQLTDLQLTVAATEVAGNRGTLLHFPMVTVTNGSATASNVVVEIPIPTFATIASVSSSGICSGVSTLQCSWSNVQPGASVSVDVFLNGASVGSFSSNVVMRADNDATPANNGVAVTVNVVAPPTSGGGGSSNSGGGGKKGGGSFEWLTLGALALLLHRRKTPRH